MYLFIFTFIFNAALLRNMMLYVVRVERRFVLEKTEAGSKCVRDPVCITVSSSRCVCVELISPGCECCWEMTAASVLLTHVFDNQIYRTGQ